MAEMEVLLEAGLSQAEARVYLALLQTGPTTAGPVIRKAGLHKATTYQIFQRLAEKGLVSSAMLGRKRHFGAASPRRLLDALREREERLKDELPRLSALAQYGGERQEVTVFSGIKGIRSALDAMLEELGRGGAYCDFGVSGLLRKTMGPYWHAFQRRKKRMGIRSRVIFNEEVKKEPQLLSEYVGTARFHPREYASITDTFIYRDTVMLVIWTARPPIAVVIKSADNARSYLNQFNLMWRMARRK